jgi:hypothetical protein
MTEQTPPPGPLESDQPSQAPEPASDEQPTPEVDLMRTCVPSVDAVLAEIDDLDELPLDQHLATYERAHDTLRSALDAVPDRGSDDPSNDRADPAADEPAQPRAPASPPA